MSYQPLIEKALAEDDVELLRGVLKHRAAEVTKHFPVLLHEAARSASWKCYDDMMGRVILPQLQSVVGGTPLLHRVCERGSPDRVIAILEKAPETKLSLSAISTTALHHALLFGNFPVAAVLLKAGLNPLIGPRDSSAPITFLFRWIGAAVSEEEETARWRAAQQQPWWNEEWREFVDNRGWTLLHYACQHGCPVAVADLLASGMDIHRKDTSGKTVVEFVTAVVEYLGAKVKHFEEQKAIAKEQGEAEPSDVNEELEESKRLLRNVSRCWKQVQTLHEARSKQAEEAAAALLEEEKEAATAKEAEAEAEAAKEAEEGAAVVKEEGTRKEDNTAIAAKTAAISSVKFNSSTPQTTAAANSNPNVPSGREQRGEEATASHHPPAKPSPTTEANRKPQEVMPTASSATNTDSEWRKVGSAKKHKPSSTHSSAPAVPSTARTAATSTAAAMEGKEETKAMAEEPKPKDLPALLYQQYPKAEAADLQLHNVIGMGLERLSIAQLEELDNLHRMASQQIAKIIAKKQLLQDQEYQRERQRIAEFTQGLLSTP